MTITMIFFDLDDTLHDHLSPFAHAIESVFPSHLKLFTMEEIYKSFRTSSDLLWKEYCSGELSLDELRIQRCISAFKPYNVSITREEAAHFQNEYELHSKRLKLFPEVPKLLMGLKDKGYRLGILSNGPTEHQLKKIRALGLTQFIKRQFIFISDELGVAKPDPAIFNVVAKRINGKPEELLYIGDTWANDVQAPIEAGWQAIWFNHRDRVAGSNHQPFAVVQNLLEIISLLD